MQNPFVYGEVVPASAFVDREVELERLTERPAGGPEGLPDLAATVRQVVARPAGAGRGGEARRGDGQRHGQQLQLVRRLSRGLCPCAPHGRRKAGSRAGLADAAARPLRPELRLEPGIAPARCPFPTARTKSDVARLAEAVFSLPAQLATLRKRRLAIALDEFQAINAFDEGSHEVEHALRAAIQHQRQAATSSRDRSRR